MDPSQRVRVIREQVELEKRARKINLIKWKDIQKASDYKFYNQNEVNQIILSDPEYKDSCPYAYTGHGDSYFVSKEMYDSLVAKCRCDRQRNGIHVLKCLQNTRDRLMAASSNDDEILDKDKKLCELDNAEKQSGQRSFRERQLSKNYVPKTSSGVIGRHHGFYRYKKWEESTKYLSPKITLPGYRIGTNPYHMIFIG